MMKRPMRTMIVGIRGKEYPMIPAPPIVKAASPMKRLNLLTSLHNIPYCTHPEMLLLTKTY